MSKNLREEYDFKGRRKCKQSDGGAGTYLTIKKDGSKRCYKSEKEYKAAQAYAHENDMKQDKLLEQLLESVKNLKEAPEATEVEDESSFPPPNESDNVDEADDGSTAKYDEDKHLTPKQGKNLPDAMQKAIIDKEKEKREEEKKEKEEANESIRSFIQSILKEVLS